MATLTVRNVPESVHQRLKQRAARNGRSMEAEVRVILEEAARDESRVVAAEVQAWVAELYGGNLPVGAVDELIAERRREAALEELEWEQSKQRR